MLLHSSNIVTKEYGRERYQQVAKTEVWRYRVVRVTMAALGIIMLLEL